MFSPSVSKLAVTISLLLGAIGGMMLTKDASAAQTGYNCKSSSACEAGLYVCAVQCGDFGCTCRIL